MIINSICLISRNDMKTHSGFMLEFYRGQKWNGPLSEQLQMLRFLQGRSHNNCQKCTHAKADVSEKRLSMLRHLQKTHNLRCRKFVNARQEKLEQLKVTYTRARAACGVIQYQQHPVLLPGMLTESERMTANNEKAQKWLATKPTSWKGKHLSSHVDVHEIAQAIASGRRPVFCSGCGKPGHISNSETCIINKRKRLLDEYITDHGYPPPPTPHPETGDFVDCDHPKHRIYAEMS